MIRKKLGVCTSVLTRTAGWRAGRRTYVQAALGEREVVAGLVACVQTFGTVAQWHPHLHVLMTDGGFRREGTFGALPALDPAVLAELWFSARPRRPSPRPDDALDHRGRLDLLVTRRVEPLRRAGGLQ
jgi:hypothetical protein